MEDSRIGIIDSLSAGLNFVTERIWVIAIPALLDLWYWLGPQLSVGPLFERLKQLLISSTSGAMPDAPIDVEMARQLLDALGQQFNLFSLLSASLMGMPSLMIGGSSDNVSTIELQSWLALIGAGAFLLLAGLAIGCLYFTLIVQQMSDKPVDGRALLGRAGRMWLRIVALVLLILFIGIALFVPFSFLVGLLALLSGGVASFLMGLFYVSLIWIAIYLYFTVDAIAINNVGPLRAIWYSANVVARNFWSALGLIVLIFILSQGLSLIWRQLGDVHPLGMLVGIAGHAFVGTGLVAAGLLYYRDRYWHWQGQRLEIRD